MFWLNVQMGMWGARNLTSFFAQHSLLGRRGKRPKGGCCLLVLLAKGFWVFGGSEVYLGEQEMLSLNCRWAWIGHGSQAGLEWRACGVTQKTHRSRDGSSTCVKQSQTCYATSGDEIFNYLQIVNVCVVPAASSGGSSPPQAAAGGLFTLFVVFQWTDGPPPVQFQAQNGPTTSLASLLWNRITIRTVCLKRKQQQNKKSQKKGEKIHAKSFLQRKGSEFLF